MPQRTLCCALILILWAGAISHPALAEGDARETPLVKAVKRVKASVVNIHSEKKGTDRESVYDNSGRKINGMGTGIIIDERGYIVTNQHVIADVDTLRVTLADGGTYAAQIISYDRKHDLAVIKIEANKPLPVMPVGTSCDVMEAESVFAIGNPFGYEHSVTSGIVSSLDRDVEVNETQSYKKLIQTDASINPGNSGGPLVNLNGEVIGINVAIRAGAQRIGFAIPIDEARKFIAKLMSANKLKDVYHGLLCHDNKMPQRHDLVVDGTESNSPASQAGFLPGDIIRQVNSINTQDCADLERALLRSNPNDVIDVVVQRDSTTATIKLPLGRVSQPNIRTASAPAVKLELNTPVVQKAELPFDSPDDERTWSILGVKLSPIPADQMRSVTKDYTGGMRVLNVRSGSPAELRGIRKGDVLVGLHKWKTEKIYDVNFVIGHPKLSTFNPLTFYIVRDGKTRAGQLSLLK